MDQLALLVVDNHRTFLKIAVRFLSEYYADDITIVGAAAGHAEALALTTALRPHVVLLGLGASPLRDLQLIPQLRSNLPNVVIVVMGTIELDEYRQAAIASGANAFIAKMALKTDFLPALRRCAQSCCLDA